MEDFHTICGLLTKRTGVDGEAPQRLPAARHRQDTHRAYDALDTRQPIN